MASCPSLATLGVFEVLMGECAKVRRRNETAWRTVAGHAVVVNVAGGAAHGLNAAGALLWDMVASADEVGVDALAAQLRARFGVSAEVSERDVRTFVDQLVALELVSVTTPAG